MFGFKKSPSDPPSDPQSPTENTPSRLLSRLRQGLSRTRDGLLPALTDLFMRQKTINDELFEEIETLLLSADVGVEATQQIIANLTENATRQELSEAKVLINLLRAALLAILTPNCQPLTVDNSAMPFVILMVGVNGVGKTTTIGKLAKRLQTQGHSVMLAAGDTFRAAAVEQLQIWGERNNIHVIAQHTGADSASVIYDSLQAAKARKIDVLIADTAGRLHTQTNLMDELIKIKRVITKLDPNAPHEIMLILDAGTGQNALAQARQFHQAIGLGGITLTKLDGTAKGGIIFAVAHTLKIPIRFIGIGENIDDLRPFNAEEFITALFDKSYAKHTT